jgi:SAM-dependent methyltransferase
MLDFDEENARRVEAVYTTPDVIEQRRVTRAALSLQPGERVLDIGSGPGFLAAEMAAEVGPDGHVHGIDPSESMLARARRRDAPVEYGIGDALALPFPDEHFDVAVCTQVYEYVENVAAVLAEARRVPTGTRSSGTRATASGCSGYSPPGMSISPTPTCRGGSQRCSMLPASGRRSPRSSRSSTSARIATRTAPR